MLRFVIATDEEDGTLWVLPDAAGVYPAGRWKYNTFFFLLRVETIKARHSRLLCTLCLLDLETSLSYTYNTNSFIHFYCTGQVAVDDEETLSPGAGNARGANARRTRATCQTRLEKTQLLAFFRHVIMFATRLTVLLLVK
jgi:hypothetical protein